jgi:ketosteroid isomerase-like protein
MKGEKMDLQERMVSLEKRLRDLEAREAIREAIARYAWAADRQDWAEIEAIFADDAVIENMWRKETFRGKEEILNFFRRHRATFTFTHRMSTMNERILIHGETGLATTYTMALIAYNEESHIVAGTYEWHMRCVENQWRIVKFVIYASVMTTLEKGWGKDVERLPPAPALKEPT